MRLCWLATGLLVACGGGAPPPPVQVAKPAPPPPDPKPACVRQPDEAAPVNHTSASDKQVSYCIGTATDQCFSLDLASGVLAQIKEPAPTPTDGAAHVETTNPDLKVCNGTSCKTLTPQVWPGAAPLHAATNGTVAVVLLGEAETGKGYADVYDVVKTKKLATFRYARADFKCGDVAMLGDTIYIGANLCGGPDGRGALYTTKGRKIANVGGKDFGTYGNAFVQVDPATWAFLEENGSKIALQDVVKGKVTKTIDTAVLWRGADGAAKDAIGNPGESALVKLGDGKLAVIGGSPANGSVATVDLASGEVKVMRAPFCQR